MYNYMTLLIQSFAVHSYGLSVVHRFGAQQFCGITLGQYLGSCFTLDLCYANVVQITREGPVECQNSKSA